MREELKLEQTSEAEEAREYGGLLLGQVENSRVYVTDFEPFSLEPGQRHFILSEAQQLRLQKVIAGRRGKIKTTAVVGYYRSDVREGLQLTPQDLTLINTTFPEPSDIFLVIRASETGAPMAGFFFHENGSVFPHASFMEFPFDERLVPRSDAEPRVIAMPGVAFEQPGALPTVTPGTGARRRVPIRKLTYGVGVLMSTVVIGWAAWTTWKYARSIPPVETVTATPVRVVTSSPLSLEATRRASNITITWDAQHPSVVDARIGILTINDQSVKDEFPLTRTQLQASKLVHESKSSFLEISLEVFSAAGTSTRESILLTAPQVLARRQSQPDALVGRQRSSPQNLEGESSEPTISRARRWFTAVPARPSQPVQSPVVIAETDQPAQMALASPPKLQTPEFLASPTVQVQPPQSFLNSPQRNENRVVTTVNVQPPTPIRQPKPVLTPAIAALVKRPVTVQVKVFINTEGTVENVEVSGPPGTMNQYLAEAAAGAARMWKFEPARRGNTKLPSESILHFAFSPKQQVASGSK